VNQGQARSQRRNSWYCCSRFFSDWSSFCCPTDGVIENLRNKIKMQENHNTIQCKRKQMS